MTSKREKSSKQATTTPSSKKKVVLARPVDFTRPLEEQEEALDAFADSFVQELKKPD
jgi:hypothetical protein